MAQAGHGAAVVSGELPLLLLPSRAEAPRLDGWSAGRCWFVDPSTCETEALAHYPPSL